MNNLIKPPVTFWVIGIIALIWNLMGIGSFFMQVNMGEEALNALTEEQRALYDATPIWALIVYGIAVFSGVVGSIALLMRKSWSIQLFLISLIAVLVQMGYAIFATNTLEVYGTQAVIMPILIIVIALFLWYYAKSAYAKAWIT